MGFRLDRLVTLYLASPGLRLVGNGQSSIPILMYHSIGDEDESHAHAYYRTATSPAAFSEQMRHLHESGYATRGLTEAVHQLQQNASAADKTVVITFDDGYGNFYRNAFPVLNRYGFSATVFLPTAYIGEIPVKFKGKECLTWNEVRELNRHGIGFGSHTVTHPQLHDLTPANVRQEIVGSKQVIEDRLGQAVDSFAYPYAFPQTDIEFQKILRDTLGAAGYRTGVCTTVGRANRRSQPLFMERLPVNSADDKALFQAKLVGAYDWIAKFQYAAKKGKSYLRGATGAAKYGVSKDFASIAENSANRP
jgi:peptidoglycan/xylan/chitin deacetylase (PgdA/CDA1 family)